MSSHLCVEFSKSVVKCDCRRRRRLLYPNDGKKPVWMHSSLQFLPRNSKDMGTQTPA